MTPKKHKICNLKKQFTKISKKRKKNNSLALNHSILRDKKIISSFIKSKELNLINIISNIIFSYDNKKKKNITLLDKYKNNYEERL